MSESVIKPNSEVKPEQRLTTFIFKNRGWRYLLMVVLLTLPMVIVVASIPLSRPVYIALGSATAVLLLLAIRVIRQQALIARKKELEFHDLRNKQEVLISDFSHRLREPLNSLAILGDLLMDTKTDENQTELLQTLVASTNNLATVLNELTMQSARSFSYETKKDISFNLQSTVRNTIELFRLKDDCNIEFIISDDALMNQVCFGNPITLKQILLDLFNSIENLTRGTRVRLIVGISVSSKKGSLKTFTFRLDSDIAFSLFDNELSYQPLASSLIENAGGTLDETLMENGSSISFSLPLLITEPKKVSEEGSSRIVELVTKDSKRKKISDLNILIVEDNPINQKILILTLKGAVKNIDTAINGKEALDKFGKSRYDLILMDIQMPVMDGLMAVEKIRELEKYTGAHTPIIAITANAMLGDKEKCISAGMDDYLSKPLQPGDLLGVIEKVLLS